MAGRYSPEGGITTQSAFLRRSRIEEATSLERFDLVVRCMAGFAGTVKRIIHIQDVRGSSGQNQIRVPPLQLEEMPIDRAALYSLLSHRIVLSPRLPGRSGYYLFLLAHLIFGAGIRLMIDLPVDPCVVLLSRHRLRRIRFNIILRPEDY